MLGLKQDAITLAYRRTVARAQKQLVEQHKKATRYRTGHSPQICGSTIFVTRPHRDSPSTIRRVNVHASPLTERRDALAVPSRCD